VFPSIKSFFKILRFINLIWGSFWRSSRLVLSSTLL
jgi:hypothetical protein